MIIPNGTIQIITEAGQGIDPTTGHPTKGVETLGEEIACQYVVSNRNRQSITTENGHYTSQSYIIYTDLFDMVGERIMLKDCKGKEVGKFPVKNVEALFAIQQLQITI